MNMFCYKSIDLKELIEIATTISEAVGSPRLPGMDQTLRVSSFSVTLMR